MIVKFVPEIIIMEVAFYLKALTADLNWGLKREFAITSCVRTYSIVLISSIARGRGRTVS